MILDVTASQLNEFLRGLKRPHHAIDYLAIITDPTAKVYIADPEESDDVIPAFFKKDIFGSLRLYPINPRFNLKFHHLNLFGGVNTPIFAFWNYFHALAYLLEARRKLQMVSDDDRK